MLEGLNIDLLKALLYRLLVDIEDHLNESPNSGRVQLSLPCKEAQYFCQYLCDQSRLVYHSIHCLVDFVV